MKKLYLFNNTQEHGFNDCYSMTDVGVVLGHHICSDSAFMLHDLCQKKDRKKEVDDYFKDEPYEVEVIKDNEVSSHPGLIEAIKLNKILTEIENMVKGERK